MPKEVIFTPRETTEVLLFIKDHMVMREDVEEIINNLVPGIVLDIVHPIVNKAKQEMIDHMDRKTAEVRGDLVVLARKIDFKTDVMADRLADKKVFTRREANEIKSLSPFAQ